MLPTNLRITIVSKHKIRVKGNKIKHEEEEKITATGWVNLTLICKRTE